MNTDKKAAAAEHFAANPSHDEYYVTNDGQCFQKDHHAYGHQKEIGGKQEDVEHFKRDSDQDEETSGKGEVALDAMSFKGLQEEAGKLNLPEEEWSGLKSKKELVDYITSKTAAN